MLLERGVDGDDALLVRELIERHVKLTHSAHAKRLLEDWDGTLAASGRSSNATLTLVQAPPKPNPPKASPTRT